MGLFDRFKHSRRIGELEKAVNAMQTAMEALEENLVRILEQRKKDRARAMASARWDQPPVPKNGPPAVGGIGSDPVSQTILARRNQRRHSLAELATQPFAGKDLEEE